MVSLNEFEPETEGFVLRLQFGAIHILPVDVVLFHHGEALRFRPSVSAKVSITQFLDITFPLVSFLPAYKIEGGIALVVGSTTIFPVVMVIGDLV